MDEEGSGLNPMEAPPSKDPRRGVPPGTALPKPSPPSGRPGAEPEADHPPAGSRKGQWTPELWMQLIKEIVTGVLAFLIISVTLVTAWRSFDLIGDAGKVTQAKDLLTVMLGLSGAVVGYYFGRISSDARASQANARAESMISENARIKARARGFSANLDHIIDESAPVMADDGGGTARQLDSLRSLRNQMRDLAGPDTP